ncbi:hypothetical protein LIT25_16055 [Bacillus sp. F19]|nr:hypothetical protein LIT25_16055 [Bacillus sp. F19]
MKNKKKYKQVFLDIIRDLKAQKINSLYINRVPPAKRGFTTLRIFQH